MIVKIIKFRRNRRCLCRIKVFVSRTSVPCACVACALPRMCTLAFRRYLCAVSLSQEILYGFVSGATACLVVSGSSTPPTGLSAFALSSVIPFRTVKRVFLLFANTIRSPLVLAVVTVALPVYDTAGSMGQFCAHPFYLTGKVRQVFRWTAIFFLVFSEVIPDSRRTTCTPCTSSVPLHCRSRCLFCCTNFVAVS